MTHSFSTAFLLALTLMVGIRLWLSQRQIAHVTTHRSTVPAQFKDRLELAAHQKAADYTVAQTRFGRLALASEIVVLLAFTFGGGLQALHDLWSGHVDGLTYGVALIFSAMAISSLVDLPFALYRQFVIEQQFGFNRMTLRLFLTDQLKQTALGLVIGTPVLLAVLWLMAKMGSLWWLYVWLFWCGFNLLILFLYPTWIAPLFNKFTPLKDEALSTRIESLMTRCGFRAKGFFVMDGSRRSAHANAYFTGLGASKRVVFFDTLLNRLSHGEVEAVLAHELGHFKHKHVLKRMVMMFALSLLGFALLGWLSRQLGFFVGLGVSPNLTAPNDALALMLFMLALPPFMFFVSPVFAYFSRRDEYQADAYACQQSNGQDLSMALIKLYKDNSSTLTPDPMYVRFYYSHPPASERLAAMAAH